MLVGVWLLVPVGAEAAKTAADQATKEAPQVNAYLALALAPVIAFIGVLAGQLIPEFFLRRRAVRDRYDAAISAVAQLQAARHGAGLNVPAHYIKAVDDTEQAKVVQELSTEGLRKFLDAAAGARAALAALHVYSPDLREYWDKFEIGEAELDELVNKLYDRRKKPTKRHGD